MKRSTDRILTSHVGSLVRPADILVYIINQQIGNEIDDAAFETALAQAVKDVVAKQAEVGIDIPSDGEFSKHSFFHYVRERLSGLETVSPDQAPKAYYAKLTEEFPGFMKQYNGMYQTMWMPEEVPRELVEEALKTVGDPTIVTGPISYQGHAELNRDISNFKAAIDGKPFVEAFMPSATPSREDAVDADIYKTDEEYLFALADAMHEEYKAIADAGFIVQLDLGLPQRNQVLKGNPNPSIDDLKRMSEIQVEAYNHALRGIPEEKVRYHLCWGSMNSPHTTDVPLIEFVDIILKIKAQAYAIEAANPRHEHEWMMWEDVKLPDGKILIPGVVTHSTNVVEHPELVAWRIKNYASVVGRDNVIAGTDCGFSQGWNMIRVHQEVQWAKLKSLVEGAALASRDLWT